MANSISQINETTIRQLEAARRVFACMTKSIRVTYVILTDTTVKVSRGSQGVIVKYNVAADDYELTYYVGFDKSEPLDRVYVDQLQELVIAKLSKKIRL